MKISKEIIRLQNKIYQILDNEASEQGENLDWLEHLDIALAFESNEKLWHITPIFEGDGDGYLSYIDYPNYDKKTVVLCGMGKTIPLAIKDLWREIKKYENE